MSPMEAPSYPRFAITFTSAWVICSRRASVFEGRAISELVNQPIMPHAAPVNWRLEGDERGGGERHEEEEQEGDDGHPVPLLLGLAHLLVLAAESAEDVPEDVLARLLLPLGDVLFV